MSRREFIALGGAIVRTPAAAAGRFSGMGILAATPAGAPSAPPTITLLDSNVWTPPSVTTATISVNAGDVIIVDSTISQLPPLATINTPTATELTFQQRVPPLINSADVSCAFYRFYAVAASAWSGTINLSSSGASGGAATYSVFSAAGADNSSPFDGHASLPAMYQNDTSTSAIPTKQYSTTSQYNAVLAAIGSFRHATDPGPPSGFTRIHFISNPNGPSHDIFDSGYQRVSAVQTNATVNGSASIAASWMVIDALHAGGVAPVQPPFLVNATFSLNTTGLTAGTLVGQVQNTGGATTSASITSGDPSGHLAIDASLNITATSAGATALNGQTRSATITIAASNSSGSDTGTEVINYSPSTTGPSTLADGYVNASGGTPQLPSILNSYGGSNARNKGLIGGKQYQPWWNVAGVDYAVGPKAGTIFKDGTVQANLPSGVTVSGGGITVSTGASPIVIDSLDFTGLTSDNVFVINGIGKVTVQNCKFKVPSNFSTGSQFFIRSNAGSYVIFQYCDFDGSGNTTKNWGNPLFFMNNASRLEFYFNFLHHIGFDGIYPAQSLSTVLSFAAIARYSLFAYFSYSPSAHFDVVQCYSGGPAPILQFNTLYQPTVDNNGISTGAVNSFYREGDQGTQTLQNPECGWNTICGNGLYLSMIQLTTDTPGGTFTGANVHDNFLDVNNVQNFWAYDTRSSATGLVYDNNVCLNNASLLPSQIGGGTAWVPGFLNGGSLPTYRAPYTTNPDVNSQSATLHTTSLSAGQTLVTMTASSLATSWAIIADQANNFTIDSAGKITLTSTGVSNLQNFTGKLVITVKAANGSGVGNFGYGTVDLTCSH
jgi:hypothetical protein